jgi:transcriptional antiterminator RfaH
MIGLLMNWLTLYTKPKMEHRVDEALRDRGFTCYLPIVHQYNSHYRRKEPTPFFPCYLFVRLGPDAPSYGNLVWTPGLRYVVKFENRLAWAPDQVISHLQQHLEALDRVDCLAPRSRFDRGEPVRITTGPFKDLDAVFDQALSTGGRVRVLLQFLGRLTACDIASDWLVKAG